MVFMLLRQGRQTHFYRGHFSLTVAFKGLNVILGLYECNYSLTVKELKLHSDVAPGENEFDTPVLHLCD